MSTTDSRMGWSAVSDFQFCKVTRDGPVLTITINRPEVLNALHPAAHADVARAFDLYAADPDLRAALWAPLRHVRKLTSQS